MNFRKNILFFILLFLGFSFRSYSQSPDHKSKTDKFGGIGVSVDIDSSIMLPYIVDILSAKPGAMAGLRSGDHIISINGWKTKGKSQEQVAGRLRGRVGSEVKLVIDRSGKNVNFGMKREHIEVNEKAGNFCEALDTLLRELPDSFLSIKGNSKEIASKKLVYWESKFNLPGFDRNSRIYHYFSTANGPFFSEDYFFGKDSAEALIKYNTIVSDLRDCFQYCGAKLQDEARDTSKSMISISFKITQPKSANYQGITDAIMNVGFSYLYQTYIVYITYSAHCLIRQ